MYRIVNKKQNNRNVIFEMEETIMKQLRLFFCILIASGMLFLTACGGTADEGTDTDATDVAEETNDNDQTAQEPEVSKDGNEIIELNQPIVDNENLRATLIKVERINDPDWNEQKVEVTFEVENKRQDTIEVQAREVSADGKMIDDMMLSMSQEVAPGKLADAVLTIQNYEGDLPPMENQIEMQLHIFSWDNMDYSEDHPVVIDLTQK